MKYLSDKKIICLILILAVFTIGYFIIVNRVSYAFSSSIDQDELYAEMIDTIKLASTKYAEKNKDKFEDSNIMVIKVQDLVDNNKYEVKVDN